MMVPVNYCPYCGGEVPRDARFCPTCGRALGDEDAAPQPDPPVEVRKRGNPLTEGLRLGTTGCVGCLTMLVLFLIVIILLSKA